MAEDQLGRLPKTAGDRLGRFPETAEDRLYRLPSAWQVLFSIGGPE
jgi:hypothetical protein